jgi:acetyl esterase/lipase
LRFLAFPRVVALVLSIIVVQSVAAPLPGVESNVVYGMHSGAALLLDVHKPAQPNGFGVVFIPGSGWYSPPGYDAAPLTAASQNGAYVPALTQAGYTVFVINYRSTPAFRYPAAVLDSQRAVRFIRHNAARFGIDPARIGGVGGSSGAHLVSLLGTLDGAGNPADPDEVNRESARLQAVVARAVPADFLGNGRGVGVQAISNFLGATVSQLQDDSKIQAAAREASPISHVTPGSAPFLLMHGDADKVVPIEQSERMEAALDKAGVPVRFLRVAGAEHHPTFKGATNPPDYEGEMVRWLDLYLRKSGAGK